MALKEYPAAVTAFRARARPSTSARPWASTARMENDNAREDRIRDLQDKIRENQERRCPAPARAAARERDARSRQWEMEI